jgi:hypothetical protein
MRFIGSIVRLQVQTVSLKVGTAPQRRYDPAGIRSVPTLELNDGGVQGWTADNQPLTDVHHRDHLASKNRGGENGISLGFTSHYQEMREHFDHHLIDGIAGENILVATDRHIDEIDLAGEVIIATADGRQIHLVNAFPTAPCVEFSRYSLRFPDDTRPDETVTAAVRFLHDGMRGYYCAYHGSPERISIGDVLFVSN